MNIRIHDHGGAALQNDGVQLLFVGIQLEILKCAGFVYRAGISFGAGTGGIDLPILEPQGCGGLLRMGKGGTVILCQRVSAADKLCFFVEIGQSNTPSNQFDFVFPMVSKHFAAVNGI